jgi:hypothetical protein
MILFHSDWDYYPDAIADFQTTNQSFVRLAQLYADMGVENNVFHLALHNPDLQGVDPFSPNLTVEQMVDIGLECAENPWYFFREIIRVPAAGGSEHPRLIANRGNIGMYWCFFNHVDVALIQPRQTGKSVSTDCLMVNLVHFATDHTYITMITKDNSLRTKNVERLKKMRDLLPKYLLEMRPDDADNQIELTYKSRDNGYSTAVAQNSEAGANNVGRGLTSPVLHSDEGPFTSFINIILPAALAAGTAARNNAKKDGQPYGNIFTTTAGKKDNREGKFMYELIFGGMTWDERMVFDAANQEELHRRIKKNCTGVVGPGGKKVDDDMKRALVNITLSHRQLGYTDRWLKEAMANAGGTPESLARDFLNFWSSGSLSSPLSQKLNERIRDSMRKADYLEWSKDNYCLNWYIPENQIAKRMAEGRFIAGLDTSEAVGRDTIALVIIDVEDLSVVATGTYNETNLIKFCNYLGNILIRYPNITLVPERKSTGGMIIDYLILQLTRAGQDPFKRIFNRIVDNASTDPESFKEIQTSLLSRLENFYDTRKATFGFNTNAENRSLLYTTVLQNGAKNGGDKVHSEKLVTELLGLVVKNDRIDHSASGHDDHVIAWLLGHWFVAHARNLAYYGIPNGLAMSAVAKFSLEEETVEQQYQRQQQQRLLNEVASLLEQLNDFQQDPMSVAKLEGRLRAISGRLVDDTDVSYVQTIDAAIRESQETRMQRMRMRGRNAGGYRPLEGVGWNSPSSMAGTSAYNPYSSLIGGPSHNITFA